MHFFLYMNDSSTKYFEHYIVINEILVQFTIDR